MLAVAVSDPPLQDPVQTGRLTLRRYQPTDVDPLLSYYGRAEVCRYLLHKTWSRPDAREAVSERINRTGWAAGAIALVVERDATVIGNLSAWKLAGTHYSAEISWVFSPDFSGHGYATEATLALLDLVLSWPDVRTVTAQMDARNTASARLAERIGMRLDAHLTHHLRVKGEWTDTLVFAARRTGCS